MLERIGPVAYRLELLEGSRVYFVFHVLVLRERIGDHEIVGPVLPEPLEEIEIVEPVRVLARHRRRHGTRLEMEILVEWLGKLFDEATWELRTRWGKRGGCGLIHLIRAFSFLIALVIYFH